MNTQAIIGIVLVVAGAALLAYGGITTTKRENVREVGPIKVQPDVKERHTVPPVVALGLIGAGLVVVVLGVKHK